MGALVYICVYHTWEKMLLGFRNRNPVSTAPCMVAATSISHASPEEVLAEAPIKETDTGLL